MSDPLLASVEYNHDCVCSDVPERHPDASIRYIAELGIKRGRISHIFSIKGKGAADFIRGIEGHHTTSRVDMIRKRDDMAEIIATTKEDASTRHALSESGCAFVSSPIYDGGIEIAHIFAPSFESLKSFLDSLKSSYNVRVTSKHYLKEGEKLNTEALVKSACFELLSAAERLSPRQAEALKLASRLDYYEMPKRATVDDIAQRMGISGAAASELLRKAERKLLPTLAKIVELQG